MMFELNRNRKAIFGLLLLLSLHHYSQTVDESEFFHYQDGIALPKEDDTHSEQIILSPEIPFITTKYESVYVRHIFTFDSVGNDRENCIHFRLIPMVFSRFYYPLLISFHK